MKAVQTFSDEQLRYARSLKPEQVLRFLEDFRQLHGGRLAGESTSSTQINLRVPDALLRLFRARAAMLGVPYQRQIKKLMEEWVGRIDA